MEYKHFYSIHNIVILLQISIIIILSYNKICILLKRRNVSL